MVAILDYGLGNIKAFANVYKRLDIPFAVCANAGDLKDVGKIILPGVGAFDQAMDLFEKSGMRGPVEDLVLRRNVPILGICVGMQILAHSSEEGRLPGLGWIDGEVKKIDKKAISRNALLPHMGWNVVKAKKEHALFDGIGGDPRFYFLHSYYFNCRRPEDILAETDYGRSFPCAVHKGAIFGVQFHPEKSHGNGIQLLKNFGKMRLC